VSEIRPDVVDFIFDQGRTATDRQLRDLDSLDAKATQIFSAATVIVGLAGFSGQANAALLTAAVLIYVLASIAALGRKRRGVLCALALTGLETALVGVAVIWTLWG
jgi:hypothetical protein